MSSIEEQVASQQFVDTLSFLLGKYMAGGLFDNYPKNFNNKVPRLAGELYHSIIPLIEADYKARLREGLNWKFSLEAYRRIKIILAEFKYRPTIGDAGDIDWEAHFAKEICNLLGEEARQAILKLIEEV